MAYHRSQYDRGSQEGLPAEAKARLAHSQAADSKVFTSDLSVNEFVLLHQAGFEPLGLVMGTSMYQIGYQRAGWKQNMEMSVLTQAMYAARELAISAELRHLEVTRSPERILRLPCCALIIAADTQCEIK